MTANGTTRKPTQINKLIPRASPRCHAHPAARAWHHVLHAYLTEAAAWSRLPAGVETIDTGWKHGGHNLVGC